MSALAESFINFHDLKFYHFWQQYSSNNKYIMQIIFIGQHYYWTV